MGNNLGQITGMLGGNEGIHQHQGANAGMDFLHNNSEFFNFENEFLHSYGNNFKDTEAQEKFFENADETNNNFGNQFF